MQNVCAVCKERLNLYPFVMCEPMREGERIPAVHERCCPYDERGRETCTRCQLMKVLRLDAERDGFLDSGWFKSDTI